MSPINPNLGSMSTSSFPEAVQSLVSSFVVSREKLLQIAEHFQHQLAEGLAVPEHTLKMIPSFVTRLPTGLEKAIALVVDLGGTNLRVCSIELLGNRESRVEQQQFVIPDAIKTGSGQALFQYVAECVQSFVHAQHLQGPLKMGFTFSFPVKQSSLNHGTLIHWNKGFDGADVLGMDVVQLLQSKLDQLGLKITITALINDTIGTLAAHCFVQPDTKLGVILGTGTNAAYVEQQKNITKMALKGDMMLINTEWGAFDCEQRVLPFNAIDRQLNSNSVHPGRQLYEKMISGAYLGELTRLSMVKWIQEKVLFTHVAHWEQNKLMQNGEFDSAYMSAIQSDTPDFVATQDLFRTKFGVEPTLEDCRRIRALVEAVSTRSAHLSAAGLVALLRKANLPNGQNTTIAVDGSVWRKYHGFQACLSECLAQLLGTDQFKYISLKSAIDGSAIGAAVVASLAESAS